jgi:hypothetical protein
MNQPTNCKIYVRPFSSQEIPRIACKMKVHYCVHKSPSLVPTVRQINPNPILLSRECAQFYKHLEVTSKFQALEV